LAAPRSWAARLAAANAATQIPLSIAAAISLRYRPRVLTDLHLHLRPDERETPAERYFTADNAERYRRAAADAGISELGASEHIHRFAQALEIWRHPFWVEQARDDLDAYCEFLAGEGLRVGIEADWVPGAEERIAALLDPRPFDYVIGSVHFLGDGAVDQERWDVWRIEELDPERVWSRYFEQLAAAARSGLFDVLAHPDLVKVWGAARPVPEGDPRRFWEPAAEAIAEAGVAVEISTAGLRKPVGELYPAEPFARLLAEAGVPFCLSSDAHLPEQVGYRYEEALGMLARIGVGEICTFERRERRMVTPG
jgi:histidinol-phosphatase (PHP family)